MKYFAARIFLAEHMTGYGEQTRFSVVKYHDFIRGGISESSCTDKSGVSEYFCVYKRFPDVVLLAAASEDEVMKYWWPGVSLRLHLHAAASMKGYFATAEACAFSGVGLARCSGHSALARRHAPCGGRRNVSKFRCFGIEQISIDSTEGRFTAGG